MRNTIKHLGNVVAAVAGLTLTACPVYAAEYHVSPGGLDGNQGTKSKPFKTISAAAQVAQPGDTITVHEGVYHERVNPPRGGESDAKRIVYQVAPGEKVVIKGSEIINQWQKVQDGVWKVILPNSFFGDFNPYGDVIAGEWHKNIGYPRHTGTVYLNGNWMDEARSLEHVLAPIGELPLWIAKVDDRTTTIWAQFKDVDPNKERVEINVRQSIFYPDQPGRNYITVRGFTMRHAATPWSGAMSEQIGLVGTHWSKGWVIENNVISHSMNTGITLGRYQLKDAMPPATAPGYVQSIELALEHGWSKQKIGSHVIRNNHISHCEKNGIHGSLGGIFSTIEGNTICDIAMRGWIGGADVAGLKLLASNDVLIRNNHIYRCGGYGGIWLDWMAQGTRVTRNLLHDNTWDLFMEVNHGPFLIDNNLLLSKHSLRDWSEGSAYAHNLIHGQIEWKKQDRHTPWFKPHSVADLQLADIKHKDARFYNNLLPWESPVASTDRIQAEGNAKVHSKNVKLKENKDGWYLRLPSGIPTDGRKRALVTTGTLGKAKIPDARFEHPDGSPYRLDVDYFGRMRNQANPAAGPFVLPKAGAQTFNVRSKEQPAQETNKPGKPHIVLFISDDHGWADSGVYGDDYVQTPNIDRLADESMRFTHVFAASPLCSPSRCVIQTGLMPHRNGGHKFGTPIKPGVKTMPEYTKQLGYHTAHFGKFHHAPQKQFPYDYIHKDEAQASNYLSGYASHKPLFLVVCTHPPHTPWIKNTVYDPAKITLPPNFVDTPETREDRANYYSDVTLMDSILGEVIDAVERKGMKENTLFIYTTDQGANWPFAKWCVYDQGLRVPFIARWPGKIAAGSTTDAMINLVDLLPTCIEAAGGSVPGDIDGRSFVPVLKGKHKAHRNVVFGTHTGNENGGPGIANQCPARTIRTPTHRYILNLSPETTFTTHITGCKSGPHHLPHWNSWIQKAETDPAAKTIVERYQHRPKEELYDLRKDPFETNNLAENPEQAKLLESLRRQLAQWCRIQGDTVALEHLTEQGAEGDVENRAP